MNKERPGQLQIAPVRADSRPRAVELNDPDEGMEPDSFKSLSMTKIACQSTARLRRKRASGRSGLARRCGMPSALGRDSGCSCQRPSPLESLAVQTMVSPLPKGQGPGGVTPSTARASSTDPDGLQRLRVSWRLRRSDACLPERAGERVRISRSRCDRCQGSCDMHCAGLL